MSKDLRNRIYSYCKKNKMSQATFACIAGFNKATLYKYMAQTRTLNPENEAKVLDVLNERETEYEVHSKGARTHMPEVDCD